MTDEPDLSNRSFSELEHEGWERAAGFYDAMVGGITKGVAEPLLDATAVGAGSEMLEVCCGPAYGCAAAIARGAKAVGLDFSAAMVECARRLVPGARFDEGDAQMLPYADARFNVVICPFGLLHVPDADQAIAEAFRTLTPGGYYGFTVWCPPDKMEFFELVAGAVEEYGTFEVPLPEAPPMFRFADRLESERVLHRAGFVEARFAEVPLVFRPDTPEQILELVYRSAIRTSMILKLQPDEIRERIHNAIIYRARRYIRNGRIELAMPAVLGSARKP